MERVEGIAEKLIKEERKVEKLMKEVSESSFQKQFRLRKRRKREIA